MKNIFKSLAIALLTLTMAVGCSEPKDETIYLSTDSIEAQSSSTTVDFTVTCSEAWQIIGYPSWMHFSTLEGVGVEGGENVTITFDDNAAVGAREASFVVRTSAQQVEVDVLQLGEAPECSANTNYVAIRATGGVESFTVYSNSAWSCECSADWLTLSHSEGEGETEVVITADPAENVYNRTTKISVDVGGQSTYEIIVSQAGLSRAEEGDFYYSDDTFSSSLDPDKEVIGIIYEVSSTDYRSGIIVSLYNYVPSTWGVSGKEFATNLEDGMENMKVLRDTEYGFEGFPSASYCDQLNESTPEYTEEKGVWFLPSHLEMYDMQFAVVDNDFFDVPMAKAKGDLIHQGNWYWTSSSMEINHARVAAFSNRYYTNAHVRTNSSNMVRCIRRF